MTRVSLLWWTIALSCAAATETDMEATLEALGLPPDLGAPGGPKPKRQPLTPEQIEEKQKAAVKQIEEKPELEDKMNAQLFAMLDEDGDGELSKAECEKQLPTIMGNAGASKSSPAVSAAEFFDLMDKDADGRVSRVEANEGFKRMADKGKKRHGASGGAGGSSARSKKQGRSKEL